jgi:hypothetical protein
MSYVLRTNTENLKQIFPEKDLRGHSPNFHIHVSVGNLYLPTTEYRSACSAAGNMWIDPGNILIAHRHMNVEIATESAQFPEKEYINVIFFSLQCG